MKKLIIVWIMLCAAGALAETPREGAAAILSLIQARNYDVLFTTRYSEWHKVAAEGVASDEAVKKLSALWERSYDRLLALFTDLTTAEFELSTYDLAQPTETGETATAKVMMGEKEIPYRLYKMKNGLWGFHL